MREGILLILAVCSGCAPPRATKPAAAPVVAVDTKKETVGSETGTTSKPDPVKTVAADFLASLGNGQAKAALLSDEFKKLIAKPRDDEEKKVGFSESLAQSWLDKLAGATYKSEAPSSHRTNEYPVIGTVTDGAKVEFFVLRLRMPPGQPAKVAWFHRSTVRVGDRASAQPVSPDLDAARDFLEVACGGDQELALALIAPEFRSKLAPPFDSEKEIGYNPGMMKLKLNPWKATSCTLVAGNELGQFTGDLKHGDKKLGFTLKLGNRQGQWMVEGFEIK